MSISAAVFCGSQDGKNPLYKEQATKMGKLLAQNNIQIIYGGGNTGLMGAIANAALSNQGKVIGVIPKRLEKQERAHKQLTEIHVVEDMHTRKNMMYSLCEIVIILPGGNGTLDEMFESITWNVLGIHHKKIILLNIEGFYNNLLLQLQVMKNESFLYTSNNLIVCNTPEEVIASITKD